ncbi:MAG TPA: sigma factor [Verrucomicrobiota bacterium]|nr:sigma factor [Verrucomicrobiota bacterium]HRZ36678.1 sigma factor [Candidatus Paceibacterota bacterium]HRZ56938.1 sigma factor [Candidatus Paceibacterota bacterium]
MQTHARIDQNGCRTDGWFAATHWSVVLAIGKADAARRAEALDTLCRTYWPPVYAYLRRLGRDQADAQDLAQAFFAHLLARDSFAALSPEKGKFRSYLLKSLQHFVTDQHDRERSAKRGGKQALLPLDSDLAEHQCAQETASDRPPEMTYDRSWATTTLNRAFVALQQEFEVRDKALHFAALGAFLAAEGNAQDYAAAGRALGLSGEAVAVAVHRLRQRYRECIRAEVAQTVREPGDVAQEMCYLLQVLCQ